MTVLFIVLGFLVFMSLIWSVHATDRYALRRFGYAPFALPNVVFMLIPHSLLSAWSSWRASQEWPLK